MSDAASVGVLDSAGRRRYLPPIKAGPDGQPVLVAYDRDDDLSHVVGLIPNTVHIIYGMYRGGRLPYKTTEAYELGQHARDFPFIHRALFPAGEWRTPFRNFPQNGNR